MQLIAGLGNPGEKYAATRHNIGFMVAERFANRTGIALKKKGCQAIYGIGRCAGQDVAVLLPQTFMNLSGASIASALRSLGVAPGDLTVIHDDIDLPFGMLRLKSGGGHGGHNGIRHICQVLGHGEFLRFKVGVGRPAGEGDVAGYVLRPFSSEQRGQLDQVINGTVEALLSLFEKGLTGTMNAFNNRNFAELSKNKSIEGK